MSHAREKLISDTRQYLINEMDAANQFASKKDSVSFASNSSLLIEINSQKQCIIIVKHDKYLDKIEKLLCNLLGKKKVSRNNNTFIINDLSHLRATVQKKPHEEKVPSECKPLDFETVELLKRATNKSRCLRKLYWEIYAEGEILFGTLPNKWYEEGIFRRRYVIRGIAEIDHLFSSSIIDYYKANYNSAALGFFKHRATILKKESRFNNIEDLRAQTANQIEVLKNSLASVETTYENIKNSLTRAINRHTTKTGLDQKGLTYQELSDILTIDSAPVKQETVSHRKHKC